MGTITDMAEGSAYARTKLDWRRFARTLVVAGLAGFAGVVAAGVAVDPYDTGRLALVRVPGVPEQQQRTANASRGRDPSFDSAVIGNSHAQLLTPEALSRGNGARFVSLTTHGTHPREQLAILRHFLKHRPTPPRALVVGADAYWCAPTFGASPQWAFPFWLYGDSFLDYLDGLVSWQLPDVIWRRVRYVLGLEPRARPDGYWDYTLLVGDGEAGRRMLEQPRGEGPVNPTGRFPAVERLRDALAALPPETGVVLLRPPVYVNALPLPGGAGERSDAACRAALAAVAEGRPRTALVDWHVDRPETRDKANFHDATHYGHALARLLEADVTAAFERMGLAAR